MTHRNPLTSSERRGIIAVALVALLITGSGMWVSRCNRPASPPEPAEVEVLIPADSVEAGHERTDSTENLPGKRGRREERRKKASSAKSKNKTPKTYRRRSPLDEEIPGGR